MKTIQANVSIPSVILWSSYIILAITGSYFFNYAVWIALVVPINFLAQIGFRFFTKYKLGERDIVVKVFSEVTTIELEKIRSYSIEDPGFFKQYFLGFPKETILVKYNKFDDLELLSTDNTLIAKLKQAI